MVNGNEGTIVMPRERINSSTSKLSVILPRRLHRRAKMAALRAGAPSLGAYLAWLVERAPAGVAGSDLVEMMCLEMEITFGVSPPPSGTWHRGGGSGGAAEDDDHEPTG